MDKQAFQQITSIQNTEIQSLSELLTMGNYYTMRKIINEKENKNPTLKANPPKDEMTFEKRISLSSDPFNMVKDEGINAKIPNNKLENYGEVVDKLYGA